MGLVEVLLGGAAVLFALNIGGSGLAPSFAVAMGAKILPPRRAVPLFVLFVTAGACLLGRFVAKTLGSGLAPAAVFVPATALCVIAAATVALLLANLLRIPQSTSWVTVAAIATVGLYHADLNADTIWYKLLPAWLGLPLLSFGLTLTIVRRFYPLEGANLRALERLARHEWKLKALVIGASCYVAMAIGSNNVANVVGPLAAASVVDTVTGFLVIAPICGLGAVVFRAPARTMGREVVPLGLFTASITNLVTGSVLLLASWLGIPQSLVHINGAAVAAVSLVKEGSWRLMPRDLLRRIGLLWLTTPLIAAALTWVFLSIGA